MTATEPTDDLPEQMRVRRDKRARLLAEGIDPYPAQVSRTHSLAEVRATYDGTLEAGAETGDVVAIAGRVLFLRNTGKLCFARLQEGGATGAQLQVMLSVDRVGEDALAAWKSDVDLGDHVAIRGEVVASRRGELSVMADEWSMASKALRPLPVSHKELSEETRVRQRYVDLLVRTRAADTVRMRSAVARSVRESLHRRGYLEVETPMLQTLHGGAAARPFTTRSNAFDTDLYLRIAPELFLKRCIVGGIDRVFELNRVFRNEGSDSTHSPEFTMLEVYEAYGTYDTQAALTRDLVQEAAYAVSGSLVLTLADGTEYDVSGEWASITMYGSLSAALGEEVTPATPVEALRKHAEAVALQHDPGLGAGKLVEELWERLVSATLREPTFVRDFPVETTPLTREHADRPGTSAKWDLYCRGVETATAYSELVDPVEQRARLTAQSLLAAGGDPEAMRLDEDFLRAMEYGMPPTGGMGMGLDRLLMALTGSGIRETIPFPLVRPE